MHNYLNSEDPGKETERIGFYDSVVKRHKKVLWPLVAPLNFLTGTEFTSRCLRVIIDCLRIGLPGLFQILRPLYNDKLKLELLHNIVEVYINRLEKSGEADFHLDSEISLFLILLTLNAFKILNSQKILLQ